MVNYISMAERSQTEDSNPSRPNICAVIVSFKSPESVRSGIAFVRHQVNAVVVVDNSSDGVLVKSGIIGENEDRVCFILNSANMGLAEALNQGIRYSVEHGYEWTLLLDQDSRLTPGMVDEMLASYDGLDQSARKETAIVAPVVVDLEHKDTIPSVVTTKLMNKKIFIPEKDCFVHFHITSGSLLRNDAIPEIGLMNPNLFIDFVDFDYCFRALNTNYRILLSKNALLYHSLACSRKGFWGRFREHSPVRIYYQTRNGLYTAMKYGLKYRSYLYSEIFRLIRRPVKIVLLESEKTAKIKMYFRGIADFLKERRSLEQG